MGTSSIVTNPLRLKMCRCKLIMLYCGWRGSRSAGSAASACGRSNAFLLAIALYGAFSHPSPAISYLSSTCMVRHSQRQWPCLISSIASQFLFPQNTSGDGVRESFEPIRGQLRCPIATAFLTHSWLGKLAPERIAIDSCSQETPPSRLDLLGFV